ncbi:YybS family protein [Clostridium aciditolerans]|uniref:YybS family protein n=1 Tax=Clostridium aciditolerans TaxID=339861 RepID=A0A934HYH8_9CLOT|nr:YybS family protein [Clostridium aciditolerans]MBI6872852.1 YybS family protein [Clostridium aciditolerans]
MHNRIYNTRAMVEAGLITALIVVIMMITVYVPIFSMFGMFILPIPVTVLYIRHNYKVTLGAVVISAILIAMLYSPISALTSSILFGITGMTFGYCIKNDKKLSTTILLLALASAIGIVINFSIYVNLLDKRGMAGFISDNIRIMKESLNLSKELYGKMGVSSEQFATIEKSFELFTPDFILKLIPAIVILMSFFSAYINYILTSSILKKLRYNMKPMVPFSQIYINTRIGTLVGVTLLIGLLLGRSKVQGADYIINSAEYLLQFIFVIDGISVAAYYLRNRFNISKPITALILFFTVFSQMSVIYVYAGLADMLFDFRKLDPYRRPRTE